MPKAVQTFTTHRHAARGSNVALLLASSADADDPLSSDSELLRLSVEFDRLVARFDAIFEGPDEPDALADAAATPLQAGMHALLDRLGSLRARTANGIAARARSLAVYNGPGFYSYDAPESVSGRLLSYLLRDAATPGSRLRA